MIQSKQDYLYYLKCDKKAQKIEDPKGVTERLNIRFLSTERRVWEFTKLLRGVEYYQNCKQGSLAKVRHAFLLRKFCREQIALGFTIFPNCFGEGLSISHPGTIVVNPNAKIGSFCRLHPCVVIGTQAGYSDRAPTIGNNVYIGPGAKIFGRITIADGIAIGANAVVNKSFLEPDISIAGVPARKISNKGTQGLHVPQTSDIALEHNALTALSIKQICNKVS